MTAIPTPAPVVPGRLEQMSTRIAFFIAGFGIAAWAPLVPYAKARAQLNEGTLGLLLLCLGVGSILAMPVAGALASRYGCRRVLSAGTLLLCVALPMLATVSSIPWLMAGLFLFGAGLGTVDSTVNLQAVIVERASGKTMMSGFHGLFSLGGIVGGGGVSGLLGVGVCTRVGHLGGVVVARGGPAKGGPPLCAL
ncbi:MFS transporter, partial [Pseudomonas gessardii]|uniref:MFS transporter n=1 Tax=Pseudomonas gessardii TaxID=78544 RepID=UPI001F15ADC3